MARFPENKSWSEHLLTKDRPLIRAQLELLRSQQRLEEIANGPKGSRVQKTAAWKAQQLATERENLRPEDVLPSDPHPEGSPSELALDTLINAMLLGMTPSYRRFRNTSIPDPRQYIGARSLRAPGPLPAAGKTALHYARTTPLRAAFKSAPDAARRAVGMLSRLPPVFGAAGSALPGAVALPAALPAILPAAMMSILFNIDADKDPAYVFNRGTQSLEYLPSLMDPYVEVNPPKGVGKETDVLLDALHPRRIKIGGVNIADIPHAWNAWVNPGGAVDPGAEALIGFPSDAWADPSSPAPADSVPMEPDYLDDMLGFREQLAAQQRRRRIPLERLQNLQHPVLRGAIGPLDLGIREPGAGLPNGRY